MAAARAPAIALLFVLALQASMIFTRSINWDEFWFYHIVALYAGGELLQPLQTLHVRAFSWLTTLSGNAVDHIVVARIFMFGCELVTCAAIAVIAARFVERPAAILCTLAYLTAGFVMQHGFSFRTDPMATAGTMTALALLARCRLTVPVLAGAALALALAAMITVKIALAWPAFAGVAWLRWCDSGRNRDTFVRLSGFGVAALISFAVLFAWHSQAITSQPASGDAVADGGAMMRGAAGWMFFVGTPPYLAMIIKAFATAPLLTVCAAVAPVLIWRSHRPSAERWALASFWVIALTPLFYKNTAAYFYVFMFAPLAVACALPLAAAARRYGALAVSAVAALAAVGTFAMEDRTVIANQRAVIDGAYRILPEGSAYFDHNGMLAGAYDKQNHLVTPWGVQQYREAGLPIYRDAMKRRAIPLFLANDDDLRRGLVGGAKADVFLREDSHAFSDNYARYWGPLWLAGRRLAPGASQRAQVLVPGRYRIAGSTMVIDGQSHDPGSIVTLTRGTHAFANPGTQAAQMWWADARPAPAREPRIKLFVGF